jgi:hypothetical protein
VRLFFFQSSRGDAVLARPLVRGPGLIGRTASTNSARLRPTARGTSRGAGESSGASVAGEISVGDWLGLVSGEAAGVGDGGGVGLGDGDSVEPAGGDAVGRADSEGFGLVFFVLARVDFLRGGWGVVGGPVKNRFTFCPKDSSFSDVPRTGPAIATVIIATKIDDRLSFRLTDPIFANSHRSLIHANAGQSLLGAKL